MTLSEAIKCLKNNKDIVMLSKPIGKDYSYIKYENDKIYETKDPYCGCATCKWWEYKEDKLNKKGWIIYDKTKHVEQAWGIDETEEDIEKNQKSINEEQKRYDNDNKQYEKKFKEKWRCFLDFEKAEYNVKDFHYRSRLGEDICFIKVEKQFIRLEIKDKIILKHYKKMVESINMEKYPNEK